MSSSYQSLSSKPSSAAVSNQKNRDDKHDELKIAVRDQKAPHSYAQDFQLQLTSSEECLTLCYTGISGIGTAEIFSSVLWYLTTAEDDVGLGMTDLTIAERPLATYLLFYGQGVLTALTAFLVGWYYYKKGIDEAKKPLLAINSKEDLLENNAKSLLFEAIRFRSLVNDDKEFQLHIRSKLPQEQFLSDDFLKDVEVAYKNLLLGTENQVNAQLKRNLSDPAYAFDRDIQSNVVSQFMDERELFSVAKFYFETPVLVGDSFEARATGCSDSLLMAGCLFPFWWALQSLLVSTGISSWKSIDAFWAIPVALLVLGVGIGLMRGGQSNKATRRDQLNTILEARSSELSDSIEKIKQLSVKKYQTLVPSRTSTKPSDAKALSVLGTLATKKTPPTLVKSKSLTNLFRKYS